MGTKQSFLTAEELVGIVDQRFSALVLYARCWNVDAAEDLVQDAFVKLVEQPKRPENPAAWLCKTIRNMAISRHRQTQRRQKHETEAARKKLDWFVPNDSLLAKEAAEKLAELPNDQREIVILRIWNQLSFDEIAELTGTPKTTVFRMYSETLRELKRRLT
jgi:RNA polymerase sigma-70 factor (ECF subfamily)